MSEQQLTPDQLVTRTGHQIAFHLEEIAKLFKPGVKLTLLVRNPGHPERNAYLSDEGDIEPVIEALRQLHKNPTGGSRMI